MNQVTIVFLDGTTLSAYQNGNSFIVNSKPTFPDDLSVVEVIADDVHYVYINAYIVECASVDGKYWFGICEESKEEIALKTMHKNIQTIAEITDVDLDAPDPTTELSLKERINDLEIAICELMDSVV